MNPVSINEYKTWATSLMSQNSEIFINTGATDEQTVNDNEAAFKRWRFRPRVLRDVSNVDTSTSVLGTKLPFPICVAPTGNSKLAHPDGALASAKAANQHKTVFAMSTGSNSTMDEISQNIPDGIRWFQLYMYTDRNIAINLIRKAEKCGFRAIVVTVDHSINGNRYPLKRHNFKMPRHIRIEELNSVLMEQNESSKSKEENTWQKYVGKLKCSSVTWKDIDWLKSFTKLPIIIKGILTREMAIEAVEHNVDGIVVSNHGGRQLDGVFASIDVLPEVVSAVAERCEVYLDSGVRSGADVAKAIALGAKAVFVGRPILWGLACQGEEGVYRILEILRDEFKQTLQLLGVSSINELQSAENLVVHESCLQVRHKY